jgi:hypothetical protein
MTKQPYSRLTLEGEKIKPTFGWRKTFNPFWILDLQLDCSKPESRILKASLVNSIEPLA